MAEPQLLELVGLGGLAGFFAAFALAMVFVGIALYVYYALALMTIARKLNTAPAWLAWIPIANVYLMWKVSQTPVWTIVVVAAGIVFGAIPVLGQILAFVAIGVSIYWWWRIAERRNFPGAIALLSLVPVANLVLPGLLAWMDR